MVLVATVKGASSNSYCTVSEAEALLRNERLYIDAWEDSDSEPDGEDWLVNNGGGYALGTSTLTVDGGTGSFKVGTKVTFAGHTTEYEVAQNLYTTNNSLVLKSALTASVDDDEAITRQTANEKERALIWATGLIEATFDWKGYTTSNTQNLSWPRTSLYYPNGNYLDVDTIPDQIKKLCAELALELLKRDRTEEPELMGLGFKFAKMDVMSIEVSDEMIELIPSHLMNQISQWGEYKPIGNSGDRFMDVSR